MDYTVTNTAGLAAALKVVRGGETIQLAPGTYDSLVINNLHFTQAITITSKDPGALASITSLSIRNSEGVNLTNLDMKVPPTSEYPFRIEASANIKLDHLDFHGSLDGNASNDKNALYVNGSNNVSITNSEFHELTTGMTHLNNTNLVIRGNYFHDLRSDGVNGGGSSHVTVTENYFTGFHPQLGDHPDAIQFWTVNTIKMAEDITVSKNVIVRGDGGTVQGIFFNDELGTIGYKNVTVSDNIVVGAHYNGIAVYNVEGVNVTNNVVAGFADQVSWIHVDKATNAMLSNNQSTYFSFHRTTNLVESADTVIANPKDGGQALLQSWLASHAAQIATLPVSEIGDYLKLASNLTASDPLAPLSPAPTTPTPAPVQSGAVTLRGTVGNDTIWVNEAKNSSVDGGAGNDTLIGGGTGVNTLVGGAGDDTYYVRSTSEKVVEGVNAGSDTVLAYVDHQLADNVESLRVMTAGTTGTGNSLDNRITGAAGGERLYGMGGADVINAGDGNDQVYGGDGADGLDGGKGSDTLFGEAGTDTLFGNDGADSLTGGGDKDTLEGGAGADTMSGGVGGDMFVFRDGQFGASGASDWILDFSAKDGDKVSVALVDANGAVAGDQPFAFINQDAFHRKAGELRFEVKGQDAYLMGDTNGDGVADFTVIFQNVKSFTSSDFWL